MSDDRKLEVIDPNGWRKEYPLEKTVIFIGSDPTSDIYLKVDPGAGIAARHLQLIAVPDVGYRLVNLGESGVLVGQAGDREVTPRASVELTEGEQIKIGEFILIVRGEVWSSGGAAGPTSRSKNIGLSLTLPKTELAPHETLEGIVTVFNLGDFSGAQFDLDLAGFDPECFELEPGPLLSSGADKEVLFRLYHLGHKPLAGDVNLTIRAMAAKAYPAEQISISRLVRVLPYYSYQLSLIAPGAAKPAGPVSTQTAPVTPVKTVAKRALARPTQPTPSAETADWWSAELPVKATPTATETATTKLESSTPVEKKITPVVPAAESAATPAAESRPMIEQTEAELSKSETVITPAVPAVESTVTPESEPLPLTKQAEAEPPERGWRRIFGFLTFFRRRPAAAPADSLAVESPQPETQPELEGEPPLLVPVEPPDQQPQFIEAQLAEAEPVETESVVPGALQVEPVEVGPVEIEPVEAEPVRTELLETEPVKTKPVSPPQPLPQPEAEPPPPEAETPPPPSPREVAMATTSPPTVEGDWWSPTPQPAPVPTDETLWSASAAAASTSEPTPPAQGEPEISPSPLSDEENLPPSLQGKKVLKITAKKPPPVQATTPAEPAASDADTAEWWSTGEAAPADKSTKTAKPEDQE